MTMTQAYFRRMSCFVSSRKQWLATELPHSEPRNRTFFGFLLEIKKAAAEDMGRA